MLGQLTKWMMAATCAATLTLAGTATFAQPDGRRGDARDDRPNARQADNDDRPQRDRHRDHADRDDRGDHKDRAARGRQMMRAALLKDIDLSDEQREQVDQALAQHHEQVRDWHKENREAFADLKHRMREARQQDEPEQIQALRDEARDRMETRPTLNDLDATLKNTLTAAQWEQFEQNRDDLRKRIAEHMRRHADRRGGDDQRMDRPDRPRREGRDHGDREDRRERGDRWNDRNDWGERRQGNRGDRPRGPEARRPAGPHDREGRFHPAPPFEQIEQTLEALDLSEEQAEQARALVAEHRQHFQKRPALSEEQRANMRRLEEQVNEARQQGDRDRVQELRQEQREIIREGRPERPLLAELRDVLSETQWDQFRDQMREQMHDRRGDRPRGDRSDRPRRGKDRGDRDDDRNDDRDDGRND